MQSDKSDKDEISQISQDKLTCESASSMQLLKPKNIFTANSGQKTSFNVAAPPFAPTSQRQLENRRPKSADHVLQVEPTRLNVNVRAWQAISARPVCLFENCSSQCCINPTMPVTVNLSAKDTVRTFGPVALPNGTIQVLLRDMIRIDMTLDHAIRVVNYPGKVTLSMSANGLSTALIHPNGRVFQHANRVDIVAHDGMKRNQFVRYAKMWHKGISLTAEGCALIYLVDSGGTRTTSDPISVEVKEDITIPVFMDGSKYGPMYAEDALKVAQNSRFWLAEDGSEIFDVNNFRISQTMDGLVRITRNNNKSVLRTSPSNGSVGMTTHFVHCTASLGQTSHLFVRRGERRMHFDGTSFVVRHAGHSAGFDESNRLRVY